MDEHEFAKKVTALLDEKPLDKTIESRLAHARAQALLRHTSTTQIQGSVLVAKSGWNMSWLKWSLMGVLASGFLFLNNPFQEFIAPEHEKISLTTSDYQDFVNSYHDEQNNFTQWDKKVDSLLN